MKELLKTLKIAEMESNKIDAMWDADPQNEEIEILWNEAYKKQFTAAEKLAKEIGKLTNIDFKTAMLLIRSKRNELENLINRME